MIINYIPKKIYSSGFLKRFSFMLFGEGAIKGGQFFANIMIARSLSVASYGHFSDLLSVTQFFAVFSDFGMSTLLVRDIANKSITPKDAFDRYLPLKILLSIFSLVISLIYIVLFKDDDLTQVGMILSIYNILQFGYLTYLYALFRGKNNFKVETISKIIGLLAMIVGVVFFLSSSTLFTASMIYLLSTLVPAILLTIYVIWLLKISYGSIRANVEVLEPFKRIYDQGVSRLMLLMFSVIPVQFISFVGTPYDVGIFSAAYRLIMPFILITVVLNTVFLPTLSSDKEIVKKVFTKKNIVIASFLILISIAIIQLFIPLVVQLLFGEKYLESITSLRILIVLPIVQFLTTFLGFVLISLEQDKYYTRASSYGVLLMILSLVLFYFSPLNILVYTSVIIILSQVVASILMYRKIRNVVD